MSHCRAATNECFGLTHCSCECERCIQADNDDGILGEYESDDSPEVDASGQCYSDADPGL